MKELNNLFLVSIVGLILTAPAIAVQYTEDFDYATTSNSFTDGIFQHNIVPVSGYPDAYWDISDYELPPSSKALQLWPAIDEITFNLAPGEYVDYVAIDSVDQDGDTTFEVIGTLDTYSVPIISIGWNSWVSVNTTGQNLGEITMIRLSSYEGAFDNLTINVVPEPATLLLFSLGGLILRRRHRA